MYCFVELSLEYKVYSPEILQIGSCRPNLIEFQWHVSASIAFFHLHMPSPKRGGYPTTKSIQSEAVEEPPNFVKNERRRTAHKHPKIFLNISDNYIN